MSASEQNLIHFEKVSFWRADRKIFNQVDLSVPEGKITAILGPSGTGKTTFLHLIGGLLKPHSGQITSLNLNLSKLKRKALFQYRRRVGMLFQSGALFTDINVFENVAFPLRIHTELPESMIRSIVLMKLEAVGLRGAIHLMPNELSGGMSRRVALARAIVLDPELMLYDEPFTGQDPISMGVVLKLIKTLNDALNMTSVIVSHDVQEVLSIADYAYILSGSQVVGRGSPDEILNHSNDLVNQFVHGHPDGPVKFHYPAPSLRSDFLRETAE